MAVFKEALAAQRTLLVIASKCKKPGQADLEKVRFYGPPLYLVCWWSCRSFVDALPAFPRCQFGFGRAIPLRIAVSRIRGTRP